MNEDVSTTRFYGDLAEWWPLISPVEDYQEEAAYFAGLLRSGAHPAREVLELGSGGGHNAFHLKREFALTLVDLSEGMLEVSRRLNPECAHQIGDLRSVRLGRTFDAVFAHDAVDYMTTHDDLRKLTETAFIHCRPGGVAVFAPDATRESSGKIRTMAEPTHRTAAPPASSNGRATLTRTTPGRWSITPFSFETTTEAYGRFTKPTASASSAFPNGLRR